MTMTLEEFLFVSSTSTSRTALRELAEALRVVKMRTDRSRDREWNEQDPEREDGSPEGALFLFV
jgi:hypothetical protein